MSIERDGRRNSKESSIKESNAESLRIQAHIDASVLSEQDILDLISANPGPTGPEGPEGPAGAAGPAGPQGPTEGEPLYIQQTEPATTSPWVWFKTNGSGQVIDILKG